MDEIFDYYRLQEIPSKFESTSEYISCSTISSSILVFGTNRGNIHLYLMNGKDKRTFKAHDRQINDVAVDMDVDLIASAADDGTVVMTYFHDFFHGDIKEKFATVFNEPIHALSIETAASISSGSGLSNESSGGSNSSSNSLASVALNTLVGKNTSTTGTTTTATASTGRDRSFLVGGISGQLILHHTVWFQAKNSVLFCGEGSVVTSIKRYQNLVAWADLFHVRVLDIVTYSTVCMLACPTIPTSVTAYTGLSGTSVNECFKAHIWWESEHSFWLGWVDNVRNVQFLPSTNITSTNSQNPRQQQQQSNSNTDTLVATVVNEWKTDCLLIQGLSTFDCDSLLILGYNYNPPPTTTADSETETENAQLFAVVLESENKSDTVSEVTSHETVGSSSSTNNNNNGNSISSNSSIELELNVVSRNNGLIISSDILALHTQSTSSTSNNNTKNNAVGINSSNNNNKNINKYSNSSNITTSNFLQRYKYCTLLSNHQVNENKQHFTQWQLAASRNMRGGARGYSPLISVITSHDTVFVKLRDINGRIRHFIQQHDLCTAATLASQYKGQVSEFQSSDIITVYIQDLLMQSSQQAQQSSIIKNSNNSNLTNTNKDNDSIVTDGNNHLHSPHQQTQHQQSLLLQKAASECKRLIGKDEVSLWERLVLVFANRSHNHTNNNNNNDSGTTAQAISLKQSTTPVVTAQSTTSEVATVNLHTVPSFSLLPLTPLQALVEYIPIRDPQLPGPLYLLILDSFINEISSSGGNNCDSNDSNNSKLLFQYLLKWTLGITVNNNNNNSVGSSTANNINNNNSTTVTTSVPPQHVYELFDYEQLLIRLERIIQPDCFICEAKAHLCLLMSEKSNSVHSNIHNNTSSGNTGSVNSSRQQEQQQLQLHWYGKALKCYYEITTPRTKPLSAIFSYNSNNSTTSIDAAVESTNANTSTMHRNRDTIDNSNSHNIITTSSSSTTASSSSLTSLIATAGIDNKGIYSHVFEFIENKHLFHLVKPTLLIQLSSTLAASFLIRHVDVLPIKLMSTQLKQYTPSSTSPLSKLSTIQPVSLSATMKAKTMLAAATITTTQSTSSSSSQLTLSAQQSKDNRQKLCWYLNLVFKQLSDIYNTLEYTALHSEQIELYAEFAVEGYNMSNGSNTIGGINNNGVNSSIINNMDIGVANITSTITTTSTNIPHYCTESDFMYFLRTCQYIDYHFALTQCKKHLPNKIIPKNDPKNTSQNGPKNSDMPKNSSILYPEMAFILSQQGRNSEALQILLIQVGDVGEAIRFIDAYEKKQLLLLVNNNIENNSANSERNRDNNVSSNNDSTYLTDINSAFSPIPQEHSKSQQQYDGKKLWYELLSLCQTDSALMLQLLDHTTSTGTTNSNTSMVINNHEIFSKLSSDLTLFDLRQRLQSMFTYHDTYSALNECNNASTASDTLTLMRLRNQHQRKAVKCNPYSRRCSVCSLPLFMPPALLNSNNTNSKNNVMTNNSIGSGNNGSSTSSVYNNKLGSLSSGSSGGNITNNNRSNIKNDSALTVIISNSQGIHKACAEVYQREMRTERNRSRKHANNNNNNNNNQFSNSSFSSNNNLMMMTTASL